MATPTPRLRLGDKGTEVGILQRLLGVAVTATFDAPTDAAVRAFQTKHKLEVDGIAGPNTRGKLFASTAPAQQAALTVGAQGVSVVWLQQRLAVEPEFGQHTQAAVKAFQAEKGLNADGIVGPKTWAALIAP